MPFFNSLANYLGQPLMPGPPGGGTTGFTPSDSMESGFGPDREARYAANVARRLTPPVVAGPAPEAVEALIAGAAPAGVEPLEGFRPQLVEQPPEPAAPVEHPAVKKRLAQMSVPAAQAQVQYARDLLAPAFDSITLQQSPTPDQPIEDRRLFEYEVKGPADRYAANVARRLATRTPLEIHGVPENITPPPPPQAGHGFLAHLKGALQGLGAGLAGGHPLAGAIMGVAGGVKPQLGANAWYNNVTLPRWEQQTANNLDLAGKRLGILDRIAAMTGADPVTGKPTFAQQKEDAAEAERQMLLELRANSEQVR